MRLWSAQTVSTFGSLIIAALDMFTGAVVILRSPVGLRRASSRSTL